MQRTSYQKFSALKIAAMRLLHCTQKLLKELGNPAIVDTPANPKGLGNWCANLIRIDRKKCLLFTNEKTLYSFLVPNVLKKNIKNIEEEFLINLSMDLQAEGFQISAVNGMFSAGCRT